ncbi:glycosyltransferase family 2 protein [Sabulicella glaciei]|uniref:Glycosyltransferase n=1 Tax=Sabulicella glaciei TaxID=2984948 RepID=A0ABT3P003_9PROT|nr:glycosyltransferase [Roseococcus sp. MDT2-1-1]
MSGPPLVSVCIPAFNHEAYVAEAVLSALEQDVSDIEVIVTDDNSTDATVARIEAIQDPRIRLFRNERNLGPSATANLNFSRARGQFIALLPSDDVFLPGKLSKQLAAFARQPDLGTVFSWMLPTNQVGEPITPISPYFEPKGVDRVVALRHMFHVGNIFSAPTAMIRRDLLLQVGRLEPCLWQTQDYDLWVRLCIAAPIQVLEEPTVAYRVLDGGANMHVSNPDTDARLAWEMQRVRQRFTLLENRELLIQVLPETRPLLQKGLSASSALAIAALESPSLAARGFGVDSLYDALGREDEAVILEQAGYGNRFFFKKLAEVDPMRTRAVLDPEMVSRYRQITALYSELESSYRSLLTLHEDLHVAYIGLAAEKQELCAYLEQVIEAKSWWQAQAENWKSLAEERNSQR